MVDSTQHFGENGRPIQPQCLPGFEHINRYWDPVNHCYTAKLLPGEYYITRELEVLATVLGSCVSACVRDIVTRIGGMNHFMLPDNSPTESDRFDLDELSTRYGQQAMDSLLRDILRYGAKRENLEIKLFGGGQILEQKTEIGNRNIKFIREYMKNEGLEIAAQDLGGVYPRKIHYSPDTGSVRVKKLRSLHNNTIIDREVGYRAKLKSNKTEIE